MRFQVSSRPLMTNPSMNTEFYYTLLVNFNLDQQGNENVNWISFQHWYLLEHFFPPLKWTHFCYR